MATTTAVISPISPITMLTNYNFYQCRMRDPTTTSCWPFTKKHHKRHPSLSLFDNALLTEEQYRTNSLPSTPLPFSSLERNFRRKSSYWDEKDCRDNLSSLLSTSSTSSGYCSGSSEKSTSNADHFIFHSSDLQQNDQHSAFIPYETSQPPEDFSRRKHNSKKPSNEHSLHPSNQPHPPEDSSSGKYSSMKTSNGNSLHPSYPSNPPKDSSRVKHKLKKTNIDYSPSPPRGSTGLLSSTPTQTYPLTDISESSGSSSKPNRNRSQSATSSNLKSVSAPSKRSSSESSTSSSGSSELTSSFDETIRRRIKDDEGFIRRAACVCVNEDESQVILISSKNEGGGWLIPGGGLESGEEESEAAVREAWEEAGITGCVKRCLGVFQSEDEATRKKKRTAVYVLEVCQQHSVFPEARLGRVREWFSIDSAKDQLSQCKPHQIAYLRAL